MKGFFLKFEQLIVFGVLILIQVLFGINFATSKVIVGKIDPFIWSNIRFFLAGIGMVFISVIFRRPHPRVTKEFVLPLIPLSLLGMALGQGLFLFGLKYTTSINTAIITTSIPILTLVIVVIRGQEKLTLNKTIGFFLAFIGVLFIRDLSQLNFSSQTFIGDVLVLSGALCFAMYISFGKNYFPKYDNLWSTTWMFLISGIGMTIYNIPKWAVFTMPQLDPVLIGAAIYTIVGATLITYLLNNWVFRKTSSGNVALFIYLQPAVAAFVGWKFLDEEINLRMVISTILILIGLICSMLKVAVEQKADR